jgi:hypothetical protein
MAHTTFTRIGAGRAKIMRPRCSSFGQYKLQSSEELPYAPRVHFKRCPVCLLALHSSITTSNQLCTSGNDSWRMYLFLRWWAALDQDQRRMQLEHCKYDVLPSSTHSQLNGCFRQVLGVEFETREMFSDILPFAKQDSPSWCLKRD